MSKLSVSHRGACVRVLLIDPPFQRFLGFHRYYYPMGLAYLAAVARDAGHEVLVYDAEHMDEADTLPWETAALRFDRWVSALDDETHELWREAAEIISGFAPDLVGISSLSVKTPSARRIATISKRVAPGAPVVVGGDHPTVWPERFLDGPDIDIAVRGEGEATFAELLGELETLGCGQRVEGDAPSAEELLVALPAIAGLSLRRPDGRIEHGPDRPLIDDLDTLPFPDLDALHSLDTYRPVDLGAAIGMRGCPYRCSFCGVSTVWTNRVRLRTPANVADELEALARRFDPPYFSFRDATFTLKRAWTAELCREIIDRGLVRPWECVTRADTLDRELLELMRAAGCRTLRIGVESGSPRVLATMNKSIELEPILQAARLMNEMGFYWSSYFLFGTPHETRESIEETLRFIELLDPPFVTVARFTPIPGTPFYEVLEGRELIHPDIDWCFETNQSFASGYLLEMDADEFEQVMHDLTHTIMERNARKSAELGAMDGRLK